MKPIPELVGRSPSYKLPSGVSAEFIEMMVIRKGEDIPLRVVRVRNPEECSSYYGTNLSRELIPTKAMYLLYRCRWEGAEHAFKVLSVWLRYENHQLKIKDVK